MRMRYVLGAASLLLLVSVAGQQPPVVEAQAKAWLLKERLEVGAVRIVGGQRSLDYKLHYYPDTDYGTINQTLIEKAFHTEEWVIGMDSGRVSQVLRSYRTSDSRTTTTVDYGNGPEKLVTPGHDWKARHSFNLKVQSDGTREIAHETFEYITADERKLIQLDIDADILPGREVKVGDTWKPAKEKLGLIALSTQIDKLESADLTVKLDSVSPEGIAEMHVSGTLKFTAKITTGFGEDADTNLASTVTLKGDVFFNTNAGHMVRYDWKGDVTVTGKLNGAPVKGTGPFQEINDYAYATVLSASGDNGKEGPDTAAEILTYKYGAVDAGHLLIARNDGKVTRIQVFDPATRKVVKTLLAMPGSNSIQGLALSADRKRVAFSSNLNAGISIQTADIFVLEFETGKINQVSPSWATNDGIAKPLDTGKTATVTGRIKWYDDDPYYRRDRNDGFTGLVRIDQTPCVAVIGSDGKFKLENVPVGVPLVLDIYGRLPNYSDGKSRGWHAQQAGLTTVDMVFQDGGKDLGDLSLIAGHVQTGQDRPCWQGDNLWMNLSAWSRAYRTGYPKRSWDQVDFVALEILWGGFSVSRDGKYVAQCRDSSGGDGMVRVCTPAGKEVWSSRLEGVTLSYGAESVWSDSGNWICAAGIENTLGKEIFGAPAIVAANAAGKQAGLARAWPQLAGHTMVSLSVSGDPNTGYFVTHHQVPGKGVTWGDLWMYNAGTDKLELLTSLHDLVGVASYGR